MQCRAGLSTVGLLAWEEKTPLIQRLLYSLMFVLSQVFVYLSRFVSPSTLEQKSRMEAGKDRAANFSSTVQTTPEKLFTPGNVICYLNSKTIPGLQFRPSRYCNPVRGYSPIYSRSTV